MGKWTLLVILIMLHPPKVPAQHVAIPLVVGDSCQPLLSATYGHEEGTGSTVDVGVNAVSFAKSRYPDWRGQGIIICLKENAPDPADIDLRGRLLPSPLAASVITPHATQMAAIMVGAGNSSPMNEGVAPRATLIPANFSSLLPEADAFYTRNHITVVNHSYGTDIETFYGAEAVAYDASVARLPTILHIFSAGNLGYASSTTGRYANLPTVATLTGNFKMAKNSVVVGAIDATGTVLASSSRGPAYDGRLKPELVAYSEDGSSGAAALTSGVTALMQQAFRRQTDGDASAALLKAVLINAANDIGNPGPDYQTGYGSVDAFAAQKTIAEKRYQENSVTAGRYYETIIQVPAAQRLTITLVWTDPPAALNSAKALVNDLDLTVFDGKTDWQPWVLSAFSHLDSLRKPPVRMRDTLNNVEQVTLDMPVPGLYTVRVRGARISTGSQSFAIAYQWETPNTFYWTTPNAVTPVVSDTTLNVRWKNTRAARYGTLEFSPDHGRSWMRVQDSVALASGTTTWKAPVGLTTAQLRMRVADSVYTSDLFTLSPVPTPTLLYACADSLAVRWSTTIGGQPVLQHNLYRLADNATDWKQVGILTGNRTVIKGILPGDQWAIAPVSPAGVVGIRSEPFSREQVFCYYRRLTADLVDNRIVVYCELSTTEGVAAVTFQKQTARGVLDLRLQPVDSTVFYALTDSLPDEGPNLYRIRIGLTNGAIIYSDFVTAYVVRETPCLLYPNPVMSGQPVTIRAGAPGVYVIRLTDAGGRLMGDYSMLGTEGSLSTTGLAAGVYPYVIFRDNQRIQTGRLLIR